MKEGSNIVILNSEDPTQISHILLKCQYTENFTEKNILNYIYEDDTNIFYTDLTFTDLKPDYIWENWHISSQQIKSYRNDDGYYTSYIKVTDNDGKKNIVFGSFNIRGNDFPSPNYKVVLNGFPSNYFDHKELTNNNLSLKIGNLFYNHSNLNLKFLKIFGNDFIEDFSTHPDRTTIEKEIIMMINLNIQIYIIKFKKQREI